MAAPNEVSFADPPVDGDRRVDSRGWKKGWLRKRSLLALVAVVLAALLTSPRPILDREKARLDAASYLAHAFTIGLDFDLNYANEPYDPTYFNERTGLPSHPLGPGLLAAPFVAAFSVIDRLLGNPVIGDHNDYIYSWSRFGFLFGGMFYFFTGLFLYRDVARRLAPTFRSWWVVLIGIGTGIPYYVFYDGYLGHEFEFFTLALVVWASVVAWLNNRDRRAVWPYLVVAAVGVALTHLIRPADVNAVLLPSIVFLFLTLVNGGSEASHQVDRRLFVEHLVSLAVVLVVLGWAYVILYGTPFPLPGDMYGSAGQIKGVAALKTQGAGAGLTLVETVLGRIGYVPLILFSSEFGLFYTCPIMVIGLILVLAGTAAYWRANPRVAVFLLVLIVAYIGIPGSVVLYWRTTASAYGWRYLFSIIALGFIGLFVVYGRLQLGGWKRSNRYMISLLLALSVFATLGQIFWGTSERLHFHVGKNIFGVQHGTKDCCSGYGYLTNLAEDLLRPKTWVVMAAHRLPGYGAFLLMEAAHMDVAEVGRRFGVPPDTLEEGMGRYNEVPAAGTVQVMIVFLVTSLGLWGLMLPRHEEEQREGQVVDGREEKALEQKDRLENAQAGDMGAASHRSADVGD